MHFWHNLKVSYIAQVLILAAGLLVINPSAVRAQLKIAKLKYHGGGDWYANKTALPNLI